MIARRETAKEIAERLKRGEQPKRPMVVREIVRAREEQWI